MGGEVGGVGAFLFSVFLAGDLDGEGGGVAAFLFSVFLAGDLDGEVGGVGALDGEGGGVAALGGEGGGVGALDGEGGGVGAFLFFLSAVFLAVCGLLGGEGGGVGAFLFGAVFGFNFVNPDGNTLAIGDVLDLDDTDDTFLTLGAAAAVGVFIVLFLKKKNLIFLIFEETVLFKQDFRSMAG